MIFSSNTPAQIAPPRYPCAPNGAIGADQRLLPGLYWANAVPDSNARVSLDVQGTKIKFNDGVGYHDKNWGPQSIIDGPRYWDWGHGRLGPYSIVWYNLLDYHGQESRKSFVYKSNEDGEGEFLLLSCSQDSMKVRQKGGKAACPPKTGLLETKGLTINYTLDNGKKFNVDVTTDALVRDESGAYQRVNSVLKGGIEGEEGYTGKSHSEEFIFGIVNDYTPKTSV